MTKRQFLDELKNRLATLPARERDNAIRYYTDFFEDAEGESEESIAKGLGSPLEVADIILRDYYTTIREQSDYSPKQGRSTQNSSGQRSPTFTPWYEQDAKREGNSARKFFSDLGEFFRDSSWIVWVLAILTCPIWIPVMLTAAGAVFGVFLTMIGLAIGFVVALIVTFAVSGATIFAGIVMMFTTPLAGFVTCAVGIFVLGVSMIITIPMLMFIGLIPKLVKAFFGAFKKSNPINVPPPGYAQYSAQPPQQPQPSNPVDVTPKNENEEAKENEETEEGGNS